MDSGNRVVEPSWITEIHSHCGVTQLQKSNLNFKWYNFSNFDPENFLLRTRTKAQLMIVCPNCNHPNPDGAVQCEACYTPLPATVTCPSCGATVQADASFCGQCGYNLHSAAAAAAAPPTIAPDIPVVPPTVAPDPLPPAQPVVVTAPISPPEPLPPTVVSAPVPMPTPEAPPTNPPLVTPPTAIPAAPAPVAEAPAPEPIAEAPAPAPVVEASAPEPVAEAPAPEPVSVLTPIPVVMETPAPEPIPVVMEAPAPEPVATAPVPPPSMTQLQQVTAGLIHVQSDQQIELPQNLSVIHIGKANDRIPPDIDVSGFSNSEIVSRIHADIRAEGDAYYIEDVGSSNGTYINNLPLLPGNRHRLRAGDRISLGKGDLVTFIFQMS